MLYLLLSTNHCRQHAFARPPGMCSLNLYATSCHSFLNVYAILKLLDNVGFLTTMNTPSTSRGAPSWQAVLDARLAQPQPDFIHSCTNCKEEVPWRRCKSNENGNEGRWVAVCKKFAGEQQVPCNFFRWARGSTSPSSSPTLAAAQLAPTTIVQPAQLVPTAVVQPAALSNATLLLMCAALVCKKRPHAHCENAACRTHCSLLGGCSVKGHTSAVVLDLSLALRTPHQPQACPPMPPPPPSQPALILDAAPSDLDVRLSPPLASLSEVPEPPAQVQKGKGRAVELPDASEPVQLPSRMMPAIFTQQNAREEEMNEERRQCELERLQAAAREKNTVVVYAWTQNGVEPIIYEFQDGFKLPNFYFTLSVLQKLCMTSEVPDIPAPARIAPIQRYNRALDTWTQFDVGHMVTLHERDAGILFVRDARVRECVDFDRHLHRLTRPVSANLMTDLTSERKYVRAASLARSSRTPSLPPTNPVPHTRKPRSGMPSLSPVASDNEHEVPNDSPAQPIKRRSFKPPIKRRFSSILSLTDSDGDDTTKSVHTTKRHHSPLPQAPRRVLPCRKQRPFADSFDLSDASDSHSLSSSISSMHSTPIVKKEDSGSLLSRGSSSHDAIVVEKVAIWPVDFYVVDISRGFNACQRAVDGRHSVADAFVGHFGVPFKASTFYDNRKVWDFKPNTSLRQRYIDYGRTEKGSWTSFMKKAKRPHK
ncbi:uncharacterized protein HD556DRAFT_1538510 [Suillus plorans]|uniref:Uncharacterized protein n=1 Tax=Suillus plorans TaxID=116603 RepID=A0A9P7DDF4_9AGAM|nr:uncharacterized protein HD556DRAFT_1538510 [Suillus plorans]KAG1788960.1 hypothetical protein HD556DRAFT_1538510 [Suillus plorans]